MTRKLISSGSTFERDFGYSRAVADGEWVFVSGTTGFDYSTMTISDDVVVQADKCIDNIEAALAEAGASLADVVRIRVFVVTPADFEKIGRAVLGRRFGAIRPANTSVVTALLDPRMKVEIEVTALRRKPAAGVRRAKKRAAPSRKAARRRR